MLGPFHGSAARLCWLFLAAGATVSVWWIASAGWRDGLADPSVGPTAVVLIGMTGWWMMSVGLLGVGSRLLDRTSPTLTFPAERSFPVYILHPTVIVIVAFHLIGWDAPWFAQWPALLVTSVALTFACCEVVRRVDRLRFCFGMRLRRAGQPER